MSVVVKITPNDRGTPSGKLAEAELHFTDGELKGLKLIGFSVWQRRGGHGPSVSFPGRQYRIGDERRTFALLRPIADASAQECAISSCRRMASTRRRRRRELKPNLSGLRSVVNHRGSSRALPTEIPVTVEAAYLPLRALAAYSGLSVRRLRDYLYDPVCPLPHFRIGGKILVRRSDFDAWALQFRGNVRASVDRVVDDLVKKGL